MTDLVHRMRTCAAHLCTIDALEINETKYEAIIDAAALLSEAATLLECVADRGEIIPIVNIPPATSGLTAPATWVAPGDTLPVANPYRSRNTCPKCDSRANKTVHRQGSHFVLECPVCGHAWKRA